MADLERMERALRNAHKAGDEAAARKIAKAIKEARARGDTAQPNGAGEKRGILRRIDDSVRGAADMITFGLSDEISAGLGAATGIGGDFGDYSGNLERQRGRDAQGGLERFGGQVAGAIMLPGATARTVPAAIGQGAAIGGAYGFGSGEGGLENRAKSAATTAAIGGAAGGLFRAGANALQTRAARKTIPDIPALRKTAEAGYKAADEAGVMVNPGGIRRIGADVVSDLAEMGYHPNLQPKVGAVLSEFKRLGDTNITYKGLSTLRRMIGNVAMSNDQTERAMAMKIMNRLDDYMGNIPADDIIMGDAAAASRGFQQGRENWARMRRAEMVDTARIKAERRAASSGTGGNLENAQRQNVRAILDSPRRSRGMTPAELEMADKVVQGTGVQNTLRHAGKLSPTTGGLQGALTVGATALNPVFAIPAGIGFGAKKVAERMTGKNVQRLSEMIRSGGKTAQDLAALARGGQLSIAQVKRIEGIAKMFGVSVPALAAALSETAAATAR